MGHNASQVVFGVADSSDREIVHFDADPDNFPAGTMVRLASSGELSTTAADGALFGVSMGPVLSNIKKLAVCKSGNRVPVLLTKHFASGTITITSYANLVSAGNDTIEVAGEVFTAKSSPSGDNEFHAATSNTATRDALLAKINAHPNLAGVVVAAASSTAAIVVTAVDAGTDGNALTLVYTDHGTSTVGATVSGSTLSGGVDVSDYAAPGKSVYVDDVSGYADETSGSTISNAIYVSDELTGLYPDGSTAPAVLIDMGGGL